MIYQAFAERSEFFRDITLSRKKWRIKPVKEVGDDFFDRLDALQIPCGAFCRVRAQVSRGKKESISLFALDINPPLW